MRAFVYLSVVLSAVALADAATDAKLAFKAGEEAFARDDNVLALEQFRRALTLAPHDVVRFNIAVCLERLGRFREAWLEYELASKSPQLDARAKKRAVDQGRRVKERLGTLSITDPAGQARLDGVMACTVPCEVLVDPGEHELFLDAPEGNGATVPVKIERQQKTVVRIGLVAKPPPPPVLEPTPAPVVVTKPSLPPPAPEKPSWRPGALTYVGGGLALVGAGLFTWFGLTAVASHERYLMMPSEELRQSGTLQRDLANGALIGGGVGLVLALLDLLWLSH